MSNFMIERASENGMRFYVVKDQGQLIAKLPSVTTILGKTKDDSGLKRWKDRVGHEEADRISRLSMNRGTVMHRLIELYKSLPGEQADRLARLKELASSDAEINQFNEHPENELFLREGWKFFMKFYYSSFDYFNRVNLVMAAEEFLWTEKRGGWAGTVDNISKMQDGKIMVIDYKNSRRAKKEEWIQDYYLQASAYWMAYWDRYGVKADGAEIWIAHEESEVPQTFAINQEDLAFYSKEFLRRRKMFQDKFDI